VASNKRERELARMRAQRQAARREAEQAARRKRRNTIVVALSALAVVAVVAGIAVVNSDGKKKATLATQPSATPTPSAVPSGSCGYKASGTASRTVKGLPAAAGPKVKGPTKVALTTNRGAVGLTLDGAKAPCTVNSFTFLAGQKYFDRTSCHRLTTSGIFVLQCGDPTGTGSGGPGYQFADENLTALGTGSSVVYPRGTIAMANAGPGTNGSQFFLVYKDSPLPPNYTPFGTITSGLALLDAVAKGGSTPALDGKPKLPVTLTKVTVTA
jgi:peptidyl-prolyl cis-trans isomerase B (cyclophilin B)